MNIRQIPPSLLPHSVQYAAYSGDSRHGDSWSDAAAINHVRVVPASQVHTSNLSQQVDYTYLLFIDYVNSLPHIVPVEKSKIAYNGVTVKINKVNECWAADKLHHWECECS